MEPTAEISTPTWDLGWPEMIYEITFRQQDFYLHMKPYRAFDLKEVLRAEYEFKTAPDGEFAKILEEQSSKASKEFFWKYFIRFSGLIVGEKEMDSEEIKKWAKAKIFGLEESVVRHSLGKIEADLDEVPDELFDISSTENIRTSQTILHPESKKRVKIEMTHRLSIEERHYRRFKQAQSTRIDRRKGVWERPVNHDIMEEVYNQTIQSVDGMTLNGQPCSHETKDDWIELVPYWHKLLVTRRAFQEIEAKN